MLAFFDDQQLEHEPDFFLSSGSWRPNPEVGERVTVLKEILIQQGYELKIPKFWNVGIGNSRIPENWNFRFWNSGILEFWNFGFLGGWAMLAQKLL